MHGCQISRRRALRAVGAVGVLALLSRLAGRSTDGAAPATAQTAGSVEITAPVWIGPIEGEYAMAAFHVDPADDERTRRVRAYVCDGLVPGWAAWFVGPAEGTTASLVSASGQESLTVTFGGERAEGTFVDADGRTYRFWAVPALDGAGIYDVSVNADGTMTGVSTTGDVAEVRRDGRLVEGTITTVDGREFRFSGDFLTLVSPEELHERGAPVAFAAVPVREPTSGQYVALVSPGGHYWLGRSGEVRLGTPGIAIIGLDRGRTLQIGGLPAIFTPIAPIGR